MWSYYSLNPSCTLSLSRATGHGWGALKVTLTYW